MYNAFHHSKSVLQLTLTTHFLKTFFTSQLFCRPPFINDKHTYKVLKHSFRHLTCLRTHTSVGLMSYTTAITWKPPPEDKTQSNVWIASRTGQEERAIQNENLGNTVYSNLSSARWKRGTEGFLKTAKLWFTSKLNTWLSRQDGLQPTHLYLRSRWLRSADPLTAREISKARSRGINHKGGQDLQVLRGCHLS